jgi:hypothetical protein
MKYGNLDVPIDLGSAVTKVALLAVDDEAEGRPSRTGREILQHSLPGWSYRNGHIDILKRIYTMHRNTIHRREMRSE